ncbi:hypothetical protein CY34DRAFT_560107 [Suillus luteus UH-Slu-Lm8-n1]|uniref:Uncharacterized protein n=1 Tax=Suillus luteus UH-Slu-Lm8-n1 TaxID=930992 RepID=A0A0D0A500_9AGAM|nr:hypothetical protein CY34DRAFT_560107 [Suillus luteus UH-Slu-Lm8-n1]
MTALTTDDRSQDTIRTMLGGRFKFGIDLPRHYRESVEVTITRHRDLQALVVEQSCDVSILKWFEKSSNVNTYWSDSLSSFLGWCRLPSLSEVGMRKPLSSLRDSGNVGASIDIVHHTPTPGPSFFRGSSPSAAGLYHISSYTDQKLSG